MISWSASAIPYCIDSRPNETVFAFANSVHLARFLSHFGAEMSAQGDRLCMICVASLLFWALLVAPLPPSTIKVETNTAADTCENIFLVKFVFFVDKNGLPTTGVSRVSLRLDASIAVSTRHPSQLRCST